MVEHMIAMGDQIIQYASWSLLKEYTVVDRSFLIVTESLFINGVSNCSSINWRCTNENLRLSPSSYLIVDHELTIESVQDLNFRLSIQTSIFLSPDSNLMTHTTWQTSTASNINTKMKDRTFLKRFAKMFKKMFKIRTWEPGPVLGNLDLNKALVGDPYLDFEKIIEITSICKSL